MESSGDPPIVSASRAEIVPPGRRCRSLLPPPLGASKPDGGEDPSGPAPPGAAEQRRGRETHSMPTLAAKSKACPQLSRLVWPHTYILSWGHLTSGANILSLCPRAPLPEGPMRPVGYSPLHVRQLTCSHPAAPAPPCSTTERRSIDNPGLYTGRERLPCPLTRESPMCGRQARQLAGRTASCSSNCVGSFYAPPILARPTSRPPPGAA